MWIGDERCRMLRRLLVSRRRGLVKRRTQIKNEISAVLHRNLKGRSPASDPYGTKAARGSPSSSCRSMSA